MVYLRYRYRAVVLESCFERLRVWLLEQDCPVTVRDVVNNINVACLLVTS